MARQTKQPVLHGITPQEAKAEYRCAQCCSGLDTTLITWAIEQKVMAVIDPHTGVDIFATSPATNIVGALLIGVRIAAEHCFNAAAALEMRIRKGTS